MLGIINSILTIDCKYVKIAIYNDTRQTVDYFEDLNTQK
jgi:hypothetical protein